MPELILIFLIVIIAFLYASVGHGGASGYLALMAIAGISPAIMKPSALLLNIFVSAISFIQFYRHGYFKWNLLWPFIILSIPLAFLGAQIKLDVHIYKIILAICLLIATMRLLGLFGKGSSDTRPLNIPLAIFIGAILGFISGMIGIGGGILLSPVILLMRWADMKQTAVISAAFIFLNSVSGLSGAFSTHIEFPPSIYLWTMAAVAGGLGGAYLGSSKFNTVTLRYILSAVLLFASTKLVMGG